MKTCTGAEAALMNSGSTRAEAQYQDVFSYADLQKVKTRVEHLSRSSNNADRATEPSVV